MNKSYRWRALDENFSLIWLLIGVSSIIMRLRCSPVSPPYPKEVWDYLKQGLKKVFTVDSGRRNVEH